jgi:hypothetical protein
MAPISIAGPCNYMCACFFSSVLLYVQDQNKKNCMNIVPYLRLEASVTESETRAVSKSNLNHLTKQLHF